MASVFDVGKLKAAQDAILDRITQVVGKTTPDAIRDLAEAFAAMENATRK